MDWAQFAVFLITTLGMFFWNRSESRSDIRHMDNKIDAIRELVHAIHNEMQDFHSKLCAIEERKKK